ncbi:TlpA family protein disulfide reductase [Lewinella sp. IMCC34191]|uniref:TlpA family protein disulfide reductase n=1 Tax=Lewinella sp. IMCC34191 TaxID=2259172 RepID=UPI000E24AD95|nr:TlpA disulfide reductase family protein [Lewinella sp. IMCC34191]
MLDPLTWRYAETTALLTRCAGYPCSLLLLLIFALGCSPDREEPASEIRIVSELPVSIRRLITESAVAEDTTEFTIRDTTPAVPKMYTVTLGTSDSSFVITNLTGRSREIRIAGDSSWTSTLAFDAAFNRLQYERLAIIQGYSGAVFTADDPVGAMAYGDSMVAAVSALVERNYSDLDAAERALLVDKSRQNIQSFQYFYAITANNLAANHPALDFSDASDVTDTLNYLLPDNAVKRLELEYLRRHDSLGIDRFFTFISERVPPKDLRWLYQSVYLNELLSGGGYLLTRTEPATAIRAVTEFMEDDAANPYRDLYRSAYARTLSAAEGEAAADIRLVNANGDTLSLLEVADGPLLLDFWATWCAPCIAEKPQIQALAGYAREEDLLTVVSISVDERDAPWTAYLSKNRDALVPHEYRATDVAAVREAFHITGIPRKVLLDAGGRIQVSRVESLNPLHFADLLEHSR